MPQLNNINASTLDFINIMILEEGGHEETCMNIPSQLVFVLSLNCYAVQQTKVPCKLSTLTSRVGGSSRGIKCLGDAPSCLYLLKKELYE